MPRRFLLGLPFLLSGCGVECPEGQLLDVDNGVCVLVDDTDAVIDVVEDTEGEDVDPSDTPDPECGENAVAVDGDCDCAAGFDWCTPSPLEDDCCPEGAEPEPEPEPDGPITFQITVEGAEIATTTTGGDDWDGFPYEEPDPMFVVEMAGTEIFTSEILDDTFTPVWNETFNITLSPGDTMTLVFLDADLSFDDLLDAFDFSYASLSIDAGSGSVTDAGTNVVSFSMTVVR